MLLRRTSVGCAVSTGLMAAVSRKAQSASPVMPASRARASTCAIEPSRGGEPAMAWARVRRIRCWSSAMLARCEKWPKARMIWLASARDNPSMISPSSRRAASSSSRRNRIEVWRISSMMSKTRSPCCSRTVSPRTRPSSRVSSRSGRSLSRSGATGMALPPSVTLFGFGGDLVVGDDRYVLPLQAEAKANQRDDQVAECNRRRIADAERGPVDEPEKRQHRTRAGIDRRALEPAVDNKRGDCAEDQPGENGAAAEQLHPAIDDAGAGELGHPDLLRRGSRRAERPIDLGLTPRGDIGQEREHHRRGMPRRYRLERLRPDDEADEQEDR